MKRYAFAIGLALIGIIGLSIFYGYVNETIAASEDFKIETVTGDEKEIEEVWLAGTVFTHNISQNILLSKNQAELNVDTIFNSKMYTSYYYSIYSASDIRLNKLQQEYRSFMRGKENVYQLYEDEHFLVYGDLDVKEISDKKYEGNIRLAFFDKAKEEGKEVVLPLPEEFKKFDYINVSDVQLLEQEVVLMITAGQNRVSDVWRVAVNINQEKVSEYAKVFEIDSTGNGYIGVENESLTKEKYMLVSETREEEQQADGSWPTSVQQYAVNLENGELNEINLNEDISCDENGIEISGESIYCLGEGEMYNYNFTEKVFEPIWKHDALNSKNILWHIKDDRIYLLENGSNDLEGRIEGDINFYVVHADSGQELFHGIVGNENKDTNISFASIYVKEFK